MNTFLSVPCYPPENLKLAARYDFDTFPSVVCLDTPKQHVTVSSPDTGGRCSLLPMLDMCVDVFASPGELTTGTQVQSLLAIPPGQHTVERFPKTTACRLGRTYPDTRWWDVDQKSRVTSAHREGFDA